MDQPTLSITEYAVLGLLAEEPTHGFAISKELGRQGEVGRVITVRRPLVYRALDRLVDLGLAKPIKTEPGDAGPQRVVHKVTEVGRKRLDRWLAEPVGHVRDIRLGFLLKLTLLERSHRPTLDLINAQQTALATTFEALGQLDGADPVELWRQHNAAAAAAYLSDLEKHHTV